MKPKPSIPVSAAGFGAPPLLDVILSTAPIALKGTRIIKEKVLSKLGGKDQRIEICKRAVFRLLVRNNASSWDWHGSCFLYDNGFIITNFHVIQGFDHFAILTIHPETREPHVLVANPVRVDPSPDRDLAVLQLSNVDFPLPTPLRISQTKPREGEDVVALGFPAASDNVATEKMTWVEYTNPHRDPGSISKVLESQIQHTAPISGGNSGGPLISPKNGMVIGVNTLHSVNDGGTVYVAFPARYILDLIECRSGMSYAEYREYLARYAKENARLAAEERHSQMDERASDIIDNHLDFITGRTYSTEPEEVYARDLVDIDRNATIHREAFVKNTIALDKTWPTRRYHLVSAKRSGETLEVLCQYYRKSRKGVEESGYSMITLVTNNGLITAFSEKRSDKSIKHTSRYKKIDYCYSPDYYAYPAN